MVSTGSNLYKFNANNEIIGLFVRKCTTKPPKFCYSFINKKR